MPTPKESKVAVKLFKYVLSYMGDKKSYSTKETLATDFLNAALDGDLNLRTELYVQIMKQLSANPNLESEKSGWDLLALLIATIPPPPVLENYLVVFLMKKGKKVRGGTDLYSEENFRKFIKPWGKKVPTAFFRGNLTGGGIDKETNQRINLITLAHECEGKKKYNGGKNGYPYFCLLYTSDAADE